MGREEDEKKRLFQSIIEYARDNHAEVIDKAYDYFWDGNQADEVLGGTALELGFINFEDWLVFDYKAGEKKESFVDLFKGSRGDLTEGDIALLDRLKGSVLSLYEVKSVSRDKRIILTDLLLGGESSLRQKTLTRGLNQGDVFATRILDLDGNSVMSGCAYPFTAEQKKLVLDRIKIEFSRYVRNVRSDGTMRDYLKDYGDIFNLVWIEFITSPFQKKA